MNKVFLIGRLTKDAELLFVGSGDRNALKFTLAVDRDYKNASGEKETDFIPVVYFTSYAHKLIDHLTKGRLISVSGKLKIRSIEGEGGKRRYFTDIEADSIDFLDSKKAQAL